MTILAIGVSKMSFTASRWDHDGVSKSQFNRVPILKHQDKSVGRILWGRLQHITFWVSTARVALGHDLGSISIEQGNSGAQSIWIFRIDVGKHLDIHWPRVDHLPGSIGNFKQDDCLFVILAEDSNKP